MHEGGTANLRFGTLPDETELSEKTNTKHLVQQCADARSSAESVLRSHAYTCFAAHSRKGVGSEQLKSMGPVFFVSP